MAQLLDEILWAISAQSKDKQEAAIRAARLKSVREMRAEIERKYPCTIQFLADLEK